MISLIAKIVAHFRVNKIKKTYTKATKIQQDILRRLVNKAMKTKRQKTKKNERNIIVERVAWKIFMPLGT